MKIYLSEIVFFIPFNFPISTFVILIIIPALYHDYKILMIISLLITSWPQIYMHPGQHFSYAHLSNRFSPSTSDQVKPLP